MMYTDYVLFGAAGVLAVLALILFAFLLRSRKKSKDDLRMLQETTQKIDLMTTMKATQMLAGTGEVTELMDSEATQLLTQDSGCVTVAGAERLAEGLDISPLEGKYVLLQEIHGGGMSRIFKARHAQLGNEWIVKYINGRHTELANEEHVLKQLNHISLPQIIDVFHSETGTFLVERYIEGYSLKQVLDTNEHLSQGLICDWAEQLAQVLGYLHHLPTPIIHCDLKPSNIMVTYDNKLVLIDFGISKRQGITAQAAGITYGYAAPEQFRTPLNQTGLAAVQARFGTLPAEQLEWHTDERTDIYSLGVILYELAAGQIPMKDSFQGIHQLVSPQLAAVICKCLEMNPEDRYQSTGELLAAIEKMKGTHLKIARSLTLRHVAAVITAVALLGSGTTGAAGVYINQQENLSILSMDPNTVVVTEQQTTQLLIRKDKPDGKEEYLDPAQIQWSYPEENIARIDGDRLVGVNQGTTTIYGKYRNKVISVTVNVVPQIKELVDISLRYSGNAEVIAFAGSGKRIHEDGSYAAAGFVSPESIHIQQDGSIIVSDSGVIRKLKDGQTETTDFEPAYITAAMLRSCGDDLYFLTDPWQDTDVSNYGLVQMNEAGAEFVFIDDAAYTTICDFVCADDGIIWAIQEKMVTGETVLVTIDPATGVFTTILALPDSTCDMAFDARGNLYLAVPDEGSILCLAAGAHETTYFAGVQGQRHFVDGAIMNFYQPMSLAVREDKLYVLDYDVIRCVTIAADGALFSETIAGTPSAETNPGPVTGGGLTATFSASKLADLAVTADGKLLLTDPKQSVIYEITPAFSVTAT